MNNVSKTFYFRPSKMYFIFPITCSIIVAGILYILGGNEAKLPAVAIVFVSSLSPIIGIWLHRKYRLIISDKQIEGYDFNSKKRVVLSSKEITSFGVMKGEEHVSNKIQFSMFDHVYVKSKYCSIHVLLHPDDIQFVLYALENELSKNNQ